MRHTTILGAVALLFHVSLTAAVPLEPPPSEIGQPCSKTLGDCAGTLTCIPLSSNCTSWREDCAGTCQDIDISKQQIYTLCGGWSLIDDCDERREMCVADPRHTYECGPSCDGPGICWPFKEMCGGEAGTKCPEGKECFRDMFCFPLRFGSDYYKKSELEEVMRTDQDGYQEGEP